MRVLDLESIRIKIAEIVRQIVVEYNPEKIILFGSAAWGVKVDGRPGTLD